MLNRHIIFFLFFLTYCFCFFSFSQEFAVLHKGRFQPAEAYSRTWFQEFYHDSFIHQEHRLFFHTPSPCPFIWLKNLHFQGYLPYQTAPLFWVKSDDLKHLAQISENQNHLSYQDLYRIFYLDPLSSQKIAKRLIVYYFLEAFSRSSSPFQSTFELSSFFSGLKVSFKNQKLLIKTLPPHFPFSSFLKEGSVIKVFDLPFNLNLIKQEKNFVQEVTYLMQALDRFEKITGSFHPIEKAYLNELSYLQSKNLPPLEIKEQLEQNFPLEQRLKAAGPLFLALPWKGHPGEWLSLHTLLLSVYSPLSNRLVPIENFTFFSNENFLKLQALYLKWQKNFDPTKNFEEADQFFELLHQLYLPLQGKVYQQAHEKELRYPSQFQLKAEVFYTRYPWTLYLIYLYFISCLGLISAFYFFPFPSFYFASRLLVILTFLCHTALLVLRCFILKRPPVSNMAETVIYVPWVAMLSSLIITFFRKELIFLLAACICSFTLLSVLEWTQLNQNFEQLQAVLDAPFWLMTHVLLVVASYGLFVFSAFLGHFYLFLWWIRSENKLLQKTLSSFILQMLYGGTALLIIGTVLGGIWAAESWGRFWDWDPKESWAFISSCVYLIGIHAYRFHKIASFGLAMGAISGFLAISFTWYGVNYILGTGLHSYGFGSGGESFYYFYLIVEILFILITLFTYKYRMQLKFKRL